MDGEPYVDEVRGDEDVKETKRGATARRNVDLSTNHSTSSTDSRTLPLDGVGTCDTFAKYQRSLAVSTPFFFLSYSSPSRSSHPLERLV